MDLHLQDNACKYIIYNSKCLTLTDTRLGNGVTDNIQRFKISKFNGEHQGLYPPILADNITEIEHFTRVSRL